MKIFACAALLLASCGGTQTAGEQAQTPETKTAVKHGPEIALLKPDPKSGMTVNEALQNRRSWREYAPEALSLEELSGCDVGGRRHQPPAGRTAHGTFGTGVVSHPHSSPPPPRAFTVTMPRGRNWCA